MAEGIIWMIPLCLLGTAITSSQSGDRLVLLWLLLFLVWLVGWPALVIARFHGWL
jgi:hypothetical protein